MDASKYFTRQLRCSASIRTADVSAQVPLKREMATWYSEYSKNYDRDGWHTEIANKLVAGVEINKGDRILDIATGTGLAGMAALERAGDTGSLVGVDIAEDMLQVALRALKEKGFENFDLVVADGQKLDLWENHFDVLICSSALVLFPDVHWTLSYWRKFLRPGGRLAVHCFSEDSYVRGKLIQKAAAEFGHELIFSEPTGTVEKCRKLLEDSGYTSIVINEEVGGKYLALETVLEGWDRMIVHPKVRLPSLVSDPSIIESMKEIYVKLANDLVEENGQIWDPDTIMYCYAVKPPRLSFLNRQS